VRSLPEGDRGHGEIPKDEVRQFGKQIGETPPFAVLSQMAGMMDAGREKRDVVCPGTPGKKYV